MFTKKSLKTTAFALCSALIIGISSGTAQASVADQNLTMQTVETNEVANFLDVYMRLKHEKAQRERYEKHRRDWNDRRHHDRHDRHVPQPRHRW